MNILKITIGFMLLIGFSATDMHAQDDTRVLDYIEKYKHLAMTEQNFAGIPASITLAQGIYETGAGYSELAVEAHNHFGIKCKTTWKGETYLHDDDRKQECFRKYENDEESYRDHSLFLSKSPRYQSLFSIPLTEYQAWAEGLKKAGYATNPAYVKRLTDMVEKYNLQQYTYEAMSSKEANEVHYPNDPIPQGTGEVIPNTDGKQSNIINPSTTVYLGLNGFYAKKGQALIAAALDLNIRYYKLLTLNDLEDAPLPADMFIFTERKRTIGMNEFHVLQKDENLLLISQREAIRLENIMRYNNLREGEEPAVGEKLYLRYRNTAGAPRLRVQYLSSLQNDRKIEPVQAREVAEKPVKEALQKKEIEKPKIEEIELIEEEEKPIVKETSQAKDDIYEPTLPKKDKTIEEIAELNIENEVKTQEEKLVNEKKSAVAGKIIDIEKAKKMEALLNSNPIDGSPKTEERIIPIEEKLPIKSNAIAEKENEEAVKEKSIVAEKTEIVAANLAKSDIKATREIPSQQAIRIESPTKNYNEKGLTDSIKDLKRKFDEIIYAPKPPKRIETIVAIQKDTIKKEIIKKVTPPAPTKPTDNAKKEAVKKSIDTKKTNPAEKVKVNSNKKEDLAKKKLEDAKKAKTDKSKKPSKEVDKKSFEDKSKKIKKDDEKTDKKKQKVKEKEKTDKTKKKK